MKKLLVPKKVKLNFGTRVKIYVVTGSDLSAPGQLVADALWEDIALNAQGLPKLGQANCSSKRSLGTMSQGRRTDPAQPTLTPLFDEVVPDYFPCCLAAYSNGNRFCLVQNKKLNLSALSLTHRYTMRQTH